MENAILYDLISSIEGVNFETRISYVNSLNWFISGFKSHK